jgi:hypothetical protein
MGWGIEDWKGTLKVAHSGGQPGTSTDLVMLPKRGAAVAVMCNIGDVRASQLADAILGQIAPQP